MADGQFAVAEAPKRHQHLGKHVLVESGVGLRGQVEQRTGTESLLEDVDVGEVARLGAAEERKQLARGEFERRERRSEQRRRRWRGGRGVTARSTTRSSGPWMMRRQKVGASRMTVVVHLRSVAATMSASRAASIDSTGAWVNRSRSRVGRTVSSLATSAAPPARR